MPFDEAAMFHQEEPHDTAEEQFLQDVMDSGDGEILLQRDGDGATTATVFDVGSNDMRARLALTPEGDAGLILSITIGDAALDAAMVEVPLDIFEAAISTLKQRA